MMISALIHAAVFVPACFSQGFEKTIDGDIPPIKTTAHLSEWLSSEFRSQWRIFDEGQTPSEMIESKEGDCEDFAVLASAVLDNLGIQNDILVIKFEGLRVKHAICAWKETDGSYSFISNRDLFRTGKPTLREAVEWFYSDWERIGFVEKRGRYGRIIGRGY
jgi:hypothetical protein